MPMSLRQSQFEESEDRSRVKSNHHGIWIKDSVGVTKGDDDGFGNILRIKRQQSITVTVRAYEGKQRWLRIVGAGVMERRGRAGARTARFGWTSVP